MVVGFVVFDKLLTKLGYRASAAGYLKKQLVDVRTIEILYSFEDIRVFCNKSGIVALFLDVAVDVASAFGYITVLVGLSQPISYFVLGSGSLALLKPFIAWAG